MSLTLKYLQNINYSKWQWKIKEFTDEQIDILNHLDEGKRILVTGSQGTGKTSIAEDILKEYEKNKSKILFLN